MAEILNAHGSKNDIFVAAMTPGDFASDDDLRLFVRRLCDRAGPFGGDGGYFYDAGPAAPEAWLFHPPRPTRRRRSSPGTAGPPSSAATACAAWAGWC